MDQIAWVCKMHPCASLTRTQGLLQALKRVGQWPRKIQEGAGCSGGYGSLAPGLNVLFPYPMARVRVLTLGALPGTQGWGAVPHEEGAQLLFKALSAGDSPAWISKQLRALSSDLRWLSGMGQLCNLKQWGQGGTVLLAAPAIQGKRIPLPAQPHIPHPPPAPARDRQPQHHPPEQLMAEARGHGDGHQAQLAPVPPHALTRWVWVSIPLVFYTVLKL